MFQNMRPTDNIIKSNWLPFLKNETLEIPNENLEEMEYYDSFKQKNFVKQLLGEIKDKKYLYILLFQKKYSV